MSIDTEGMSVFERMVKLVKKEHWKTILKACIWLSILCFILMGGFGQLANQMFNTAMEQYQSRVSKEHSEAMQMRRNVKPTIYDLLTQLRVKLDADRVFVMEFHNGTSNVAGLPFLYGEMTYEVTSEGTLGVDEDYTGLNLSRFMFAHVLEEKRLFVGTIEELAAIDEKFARRLASNDVTYLAIMHLNGIYSELGYVGLTYCDNHTPKAKELIMNELRAKSQQLSTLLDVYRPDQ